MDIVLFILLAAALLAVVYGVWRYWDNLVNSDPDEEAFDRRMAALNERQANRFSDDQLTKPPTDEDAWQIIQRRGRRLRRDRYGGDMARRTRERRSRTH